MYLGKRKVSGRSFVSGFSELPKRLKDNELKALVVKLVSGDTSVIEEIALSHLGLTIQIVGRYVEYFPRKADDLMGTAQLELVESINRFILKHENHNITPYLVHRIHVRLAEFLRQDDKLIKLTRYGADEAKEKSKTEGVPVEMEFIEFDTLTKRHNNILISRISISDDHKFIIEDLIDKCNFTRMEYLVYTKLTEGYTEADIAKELQYTRSSINLAKKRMVEKLSRFVLTEEELLERTLNNLQKKGWVC